MTPLKNLEPDRAIAARGLLAADPEGWLSVETRLKKDPTPTALPERWRLAAGTATRIAAASAVYSLMMRDAGLAWRIGFASSRSCKAYHSSTIPRQIVLV